ncbi:hypothetical protein PIB30_050076, partial [Stylosanthes scabra]|nr:hypothetical protein [Stylosanthes scabra]
RDGSFVLIAETSTGKILRLWLHGPNAGELNTFAVVPGFPDNIRRNSEGEFWVALHVKGTPFSRWVTSNAWIGKALMKVGFNLKQLHSSISGWKPHATAVKLSEKGEILEVLEDCEGRKLKFISEVEEKDGKLWIASVDISCETDSLDTFLTTQLHGYSELAADKDLIIKIHQVLQWNWNAEVVLIQRTVNNVADFLAKKAIDKKVEYVELLKSMYDMHNLLCDVPSISTTIC